MGEWMGLQLLNGVNYISCYFYGHDHINMKMTKAEIKAHRDNRFPVLNGF